MTDELLLGDELLLLLSLSEKGELHSPETIEVALAGAGLIELALAGRVGFEDDN